MRSQNAVELMSENSTTIALDQYLQAMEHELNAALGGSTRTLLINVDNVAVPVEVARTIGSIVSEVVASLQPAAADCVVQVACGADRAGSLTLEISDEPVNVESRGGARQLSGPRITAASALVAQIGGQMAIEHANPSLRCTIVIPSHAAA